MTQPVSMTRAERRAALTNLPDEDSLTRGLTSVLVAGRAGATVTIDRRRANIFATTYPSEYVTCHVSDEAPLDLFCKYGPRAPSDRLGHRGGFEHEALAQRHIRCIGPEGPPGFHGSFGLSASTMGLVFEDLTGATRMTWIAGDEGIRRSADWLGRFHASRAYQTDVETLAPLRHYTLEYYLGWAERAARFVALHRSVPPWLTKLCSEFPRLAACLVAAPSTVVHGEFYPHNILTRGGIIHPVDWETAVTAAGEIDLAALTEGWPEPVSARCEAGYRKARWPGGAPVHFEPTLLAARIYMNVRWLGERPELTRVECSRRRWARLHRLARELDAL